MTDIFTNFKSRFRRKTVTDRQFTNADFPANFQNATVVGIDFSGLDLTDSDFAHATVADCNFAGCDLTGVNFFGAILTNCNFVGAKISTHAIYTWRTIFPDDVSVVSNQFDDAGINALKQLFQFSADADKRAKDWMDRHPIRERWQPGGKLDSPWN